jgi:F-type H+-transporting ATPase subunit b
MRKKLLWLYAFLAVASVAAPVWADDATQPSLLPNPGWNELAASIWVLISFVILLIILKKSAWGPVLASLKGREDRIRNDIRSAEEANAKAAALLKEHEQRISGAEQQVRDILAKAALDAEKIATNIKTQAQADGEAQIKKARQEIENAQRDAVRQVYEKAAEMATEVASKIIGRELRPQDQQDLVNQTLGQLESIGKRN